MQLKTILLSAMAATESLAAIALGVRTDMWGSWNVAWIEGTSPCPAGTNYGLGVAHPGCGIPFVVASGTPGTGAYMIGGCGTAVIDLRNPANAVIGRCTRVSGPTYAPCAPWTPGGSSITKTYICS